MSEFDQVDKATQNTGHECVYICSYVSINVHTFISMSFDVLCVNSHQIQNLDINLHPRFITL